MVGVYDCAAWQVCGEAPLLRQCLMLLLLTFEHLLEVTRVPMRLAEDVVWVDVPLRLQGLQHCSGLGPLRYRLVAAIRRVLVVIPAWGTSECESAGN